jgi:hypothetical protein
MIWLKICLIQVEYLCEQGELREGKLIKLQIVDLI